MKMLSATVVNVPDSSRTLISRELLKLDSCICAEYKDLGALVASYHPSDAERSILVAMVDNPQQLCELQSILAPLGNSPCLAILSFQPAVRDLQLAMRVGATEVLLSPLNANDFREAYESINMRFRQSDGLADVIFVVGAHGGVGASSLAVNLAYECAEQYQRHTVLAECSNCCGVILSYLDRNAKRHIDDIFNLKDTFDLFAVNNALLRYSEHLSILPGESHVLGSVGSHRSLQIDHLLACLRQLSDVVIADISIDTLVENQALVRREGQRVLLVCDHSIPSLGIAKQCVDEVFDGHADMLVVNRYDASLECMRTSKIVESVGVQRVRTISDDHHAFTEALNIGQPLRYVAPRSPAFQDLVEISCELLELENDTASSHPRTDRNPNFADRLREFSQSVAHACHVWS